MLKKKWIMMLAVTVLFTVITVRLIFSEAGNVRTVSVLTVAEGTNSHQLYEMLKSRSIADSEKLFRISLFISGIIHGPIKPGLYEIKAPVTYINLTGKFSRGDVATLTFPEGLTQWEVAELIEKKLSLYDSPYLYNLKIGVPNHEGRLFPATYRITSNDPEKLVNKMLETYERRTVRLSPTKADLILASMIQKEGAMVKEFRRISGVFHNRLKKNIKLESDPTLQYIVGKIRLTKEILKNRSPYNTYLFHGLPPGPICNPGLAALEAAKNPEAHAFYFFVSMKDGRHYFSKTKLEHFRAVGFYLFGYQNGFIPEEGSYFLLN